MNLIGRALKNPHAVAVGVLVTLVIGATVIPRMGVDLLPTFKTPAVQILTFYPGMPAEIVEQDISSRLQRWTGQANGVARQEAKSMVGVSVVKNFFRPDIDPNTAMSMTSSLAISDLYYLPPGTIPPMVMPFDPTATMPLAVITVSSPTADEARLYDVAYFELRNRLQAISGVIAPAVYGGKLRRILAYVDPAKLQARSLSPLDVINAIRSHNVLIPTGNAKFGELDYQIDANGMVRQVSEINDLPIRLDADGRPIYVRDVAQAKDTAQIQTNIVRVDGRRQVYIPIYRQPGANTLAIVDGVRAQLAAIKQRLPADINLDLVMDQSATVRRSIRELELEGLLGAALAALMIFLFIGSIRSTIIVTLTLPLAIVASLVGLFVLGQTVNAMTLGGLALSVGLLIDQSIVVIENIERHLALGKPALQAAHDGAAEVAGSLLVITIIILAVFFPALFLVGMGKLLFSALALAVACAVCASYLAAITLVPPACARLLRRGRRASASERSTGFARIQSAYVRLLDACFRRRFLVLGAVGALFGASLLLYPRLGKELFPQVDSGQLTIRLRAASGLRIERTEEIVQRVEQIIDEVIPSAERVKVISNIGVLLEWPAAYTPNSGPMDAFINVQLAERRTRTAQDYAAVLRQRLRASVPNVEVALDTAGLLTSALTFGLPSPINVQIEGKNLETAQELAQRIQRRIAAVPGAEDVRIQQRHDYPLIRIDIDRVKAAAVGLTQEQVVKNIVTALNSSVNFSPSFWIDHSNGNHYFLGAQYSEGDIDSLETLRNLPITRADPSAGPSRSVLLRNIASFHRAVAPTEVTHVNITRVTDVFANVQGRDVGAVAADVKRALADLVVPAGFRVLHQGEVASMEAAFANMTFGLGLAIVLVYLVLVVKFRSFVEPLIILAVAPLGVSGVIVALLACGATLNIQSWMGVIMMVGITVSYSVLYLDHANRRVDDGASVREAIRDAARVRLRPILMTSLAAILGMVPMALAQKQAGTPLAIAVIGGLSASTLLKLLVVPVLYTCLKRPRVRTERPDEPVARISTTTEAMA